MVVLVVIVMLIMEVVMAVVMMVMTAAGEEQGADQIDGEAQDGDQRGLAEGDRARIEEPAHRLARDPQGHDHRWKRDRRSECDRTSQEDRSSTDRAEDRDLPGGDRTMGAVDRSIGHVVEDHPRGVEGHTRSDQSSDLEPIDRTGRVSGQIVSGQRVARGGEESRQTDEAEERMGHPEFAAPQFSR